MKKILLSFFVCVLYLLTFVPTSFASSFSDTFTDSNGISLPTHNSTWECLINSSSILNNVAISDTGDSYCISNNIWSNGYAQITGNIFSTSSRMRILARNNTYPNQYICEVTPTGSRILKGSDSLTSGSTTISTGTHTLKCETIGNIITAYWDNIEIMQASDSSITSGSAGFFLDGNTATYDNWYSCDNECSLEFSFLNIPLLKQTSEPWQGLGYDTAHLWNPSDPTINSWGCAMTSAAMVFTYHGISKLPDGTDLDPGTLNAWLNNQPDGYVREGWVNWIALSRLSKLATDINGITTFDALEYKRKHGTDTQLLTDDLENGNPDILEQPGHFVVAKGVAGDTFTINDPYYDRETLNDGYSNTFLSLGRYIPSNTDLSYIMLVANSNVILQLLDSNNNLIAESFVQQSLVDPLNPTNQNESVSLLYAPQPDSGNYKINVLGNDSDISEISVYLYDAEGDVSLSNNQISGNESFIIGFDKNNSNNSTAQKTVTFTSTLEDIHELRDLHQIKIALGVSTYALIKNAEHLNNKNNNKQAKNLIDEAISLVEKNPEWFIDSLAKEILLYDFNQLKVSLQTNI